MSSSDVYATQQRPCDTTEMVGIKAAYPEGNCDQTYRGLIAAEEPN